MQTAENPKKSKELSYLLHPNPLVRKLHNLKETSADHVTYGGIARKCFFYMVTLLLGVILAMYLNTLNPIEIATDEGIFNASPIALALAGIALILFILTPILAFLLRKTLPVTGALYCASTGYLYTLVALLVDGYSELIGLAILLTVMTVLVMAFLYAKRIVKVTQKFKTVLTTLMITLVASSLLALIGSLIPATRGIVTALTANPVLSIGVSVVYVVIAALFLLVDFSTMEDAVNNQLPREYEWLAAFSLTFSVIWLFLKILELLIKLKDQD